ncbi:MAG: DUF2835 domain-containing protein [Pseudomonadales bacterium]
MSVRVQGMQTLLIKLSIERSEVLRYYSGRAQNILASTPDGRRVQFPARFVRPFVNQSGLHGSFKLNIDQDNKLLSIDKL